MAPPLMVISMHRSGSSFVASLLHGSGVHMGSRLMAPGNDNPLGFFENLDFVEFHERWLRLNGYDRAGWTAPQKLELPDEAVQEATDILRRNGMVEPWGWKDPRTTLFADFWSTLVPNARFVFLYREPAEVVASLMRRRDAPIVADPELAARAWLGHNAIILRLTRANKSRCLLANVNVVTREPKRFLTMASERLDVRLKTDIGSTFEESLMTMQDATAERPTLLRYLMPEVERLFLDLELEADLALGVHRDGAVTPRRARTVFFGGWLQQSASPTREVAAEDASAARQMRVESLQSEVNKSLIAVRSTLKKHRKAVSNLSERVQ